MSDTQAATGALGGKARDAKAEWAWHPPLPIENSPLFAWPPRPAKALKWLATSGFLLSEKAILVALATLTWLYLQPALERCVELRLDWILAIYARNLGLMLLVAGSLHLYFHRFKRQGAERKFMARDFSRRSRSFQWRDQVRDNAFWTLASGVAIWSAYEVLFIWAYANSLIPYLDWRAHPLWFGLLFLLIPIFESMHFYWIHRLLHWRPLYKLAHALHHRNINTGPWSGISMHPLEHILYFSSVLIHWLVASHPVHVLYHMQFLTLAAVTSHCGFESLLVRDKSRLALGSFHHQLHHRYFECNYGNTEMPWDAWFGTFHDGTPEATTRLRKKLRQRV